MKKNLLFLGNDGNLINEILKLKHVNLIGVVADEVSEVGKKYFGSSFSIGKKLEVSIVSQKDFNKNYKEYFRNIFRDVDIIFMQGYHYKIKKDLFKNKRIKVINFHQSLLPKYGGRHPLNWLIIKGEKITGITFHYINENFDEGDIILQKKIRISRNDNVISLYNKTIKSGSKYIRKVFDLIYNNSFVPLKQDLTKRKFFPPRSPEDGEILKSNTVEQIRNKIRALVFPYPGAFIRLKGKKIIIDDVRELRDSRKYSKIEFVDKYGGNIVIKAQDGLLRVTKIRNQTFKI